MSYRRPFWEEREGVWETHWRLSQTVQAKMLIFSQEASAEVLAGRGKGSSEILFYTAVLNIVSTYISKFPPPSHVVWSHSHAQAQLCPHVLLNSHTCILPLTFTHSHCPSHSHLCSTALPILYQQRCLNPIEIKNSFENSPFKKKKFNSKQMDLIFIFWEVSIVIKSISVFHSMLSHSFLFGIQFHFPNLAKLNIFK